MSGSESFNEYEYSDFELELDQEIPEIMMRIFDKGALEGKNISKNVLFSVDDTDNEFMIKNFVIQSLVRTVKLFVRGVENFILYLFVAMLGLCVIDNLMELLDV